MLAEVENQIGQDGARLWMDFNPELEGRTKSEVYQYYFDTCLLAEVLLTKSDQVVMGFEFC